MTFSGYELLAGLVVVTIIFLYVATRKGRELQKVMLKELQGQIFSLFVPGKKLTIPEVFRRLKEVTAGRKDVPLYYIYKCLGQLVKEGKILQEVEPEKYNKYDHVVTRYFLPD